MTISIRMSGDIAFVTVDNPPINAINHAVRDGLRGAVATLDADPDVKAVVLACQGRTFIAGADVREFGKPPRAPQLPDIVRAIAASQTPWIAAIHGTALGGGLEIAMACHFRIAKPDAKLGLPEVNIGVVPGAGGTVMLPRLVPALTALEMIATGKPVSAAIAKATGLVDQIAEGELPQAAESYARNTAVGLPRASVFNRPVTQIDDQPTFDKTADRIETRAKGQTSPKEAVRLVRNALTLPVKDALTEERATFLRLRDSDQARALRHIFFAERSTAKIDRIKNVAPRASDTIGVIGGGTMGAGIAAACLLAGMSVIMIERDTDGAQAGADRLRQIVDGSRKRGLLTDAQHTALLTRFHATADYADLAKADLVIEAVFEDMAVKKEVFARLEADTRPDCILASNTSYLDLNQIARSVVDPSRVIGLHFFSPAHIMKLLEIVVPEAIADDVLATGAALAKKLRKIPVLSGVCDGFIANRIMSAYRRECEYMLEDGALPWEIDAAMTAYGFPMGLYQMQDLAGLDIAWAMRKRKAATRDPNERYVEIADKLCEMGRFGRKTDRGWYLYDDGRTRPDPEVEELILAESRRKGIARKAFDPDAIMRRILATMQTEGTRILAEGIARSAEDIDVVMVNAYGFPRWKGGPMFQADINHVLA